VIDLRLRFGLAEADVTDESRIMVVNVAGKTIGIVVDAVSEVLRVSSEQIAPPPPTVVSLVRMPVQISLDRQANQFGHGIGLHLLEDRVAAALDRAHAESQFPGNRFVWFPLDDHVHDFAFARRQ
jgi:hypothetical protein